MKMTLDDALAALSLATTATLTEAKVAYRKLALQFHPDHGGDEEKFKLVSEAYLLVREAIESLGGLEAAKEAARENDFVTNDVEEFVRRYNSSIHRPTGGTTGESVAENPDPRNLGRKSFLGRPSGGYKK